MDAVTCVIVGQLVAAGCHSAVRPSPTEAVSILRQSVVPYVYVERGDGPRAFIIPYDGPYDPPQSPIQPLAPFWTSGFYGGFYGSHGVRGGTYGSRANGYRPVAPVDRRTPAATREAPAPPRPVMLPAPSGVGVRRMPGVSRQPVGGAGRGARPK